MHTIKAHAKVNIFLKITGHSQGYHMLLSRFVRVDNLYDSISFVPQACEELTIEGCVGVDRETNTIYKAYRALQQATSNKKIEQFFQKHKVAVNKQIPSQAGLGGGSSDAAAFMRLTNEVCGLDLCVEKLSDIGSSIGADLPFFIHDYSSANVSGFGEIVEPFVEEPLSLELYTPPLGCDTAQVYKTFKNYFLPTIDSKSFEGWESRGSIELLESIGDPLLLNDLYLAAQKVYPELQNYARDGWYFSGSGSTFFKYK